MTITTYTDREIALRQQLAAALQLAQLNGEIAAELKADKLALEEAIESSRKQEPVAWMRKDGDMITALEKRPDYAYTHYYDRPLYADPVVALDVKEKYDELIYAVHRKFPNETRHETALRYIKRMEEPATVSIAKAMG